MACITRHVSVAFVLATTSVSIDAAYAANHKPVILGAIPDSAVTPQTLTILGTDFGSSLPSLTLDGMVLAVTSFSLSEVTAMLPPSLNPGSYSLTLIPGPPDENRGQAQIAATIGAVGPRGAAGPQGPPGTSSVDVQTATASSNPVRGGLFQAVATLDAQPGTYLIVFTSNIVNTTSNLLAPIQTIACAIANITGLTQITLPQDANRGVMALNTVATFTRPTTIDARCAMLPPIGTNGTSDNNVLTAVKIH